MKKRNLLASGIAVLLAVTMVLGGGTFAYLSGTTGEVENTFTQNNNGVELTETTGGTYDIVPGTSQKKDPTVTATYTLDSYVFVEVTDSTVVNGVELVDYAIESGWTLLSTTDNDDGSTTYVYYQLLTADSRSETVEWLYDKDDDVYVYDASYDIFYIWDKNAGTIILQGGDDSNLIGTEFYANGKKIVSEEKRSELPVLVGNKVSYPDTLTNDDMNYANAVSLTFQAYIIQKEPFNDPSAAWAVLNGAAYVAVKADENTTLAQALASAVSAASAGETTYIALPEAGDDTEAVALSRFVSVSDGKDIVIDLNGNTLSGGSSSRSVQVSGGAELTLVDGEIENDNGFGVMAFGSSTVTLDNVDVTASSYAVVADNSTIVAEGATITSTGSAAVFTQSGNNTVTLTDCVIVATEENNPTAIGIFDQGANNEITVEGCTITSAYFGVYHNGSTSPVTITLKDSTITDTASTGVYISNASTAGREKQTLVIDNCTITGGTAVEFKHTNATITNSTLIATSTPTASHEFGNGTCSSGYSLACTTNSATDYVTGDVVVNGCTFQVNNGTSTSRGYVFVFNVAEGYSVTIDGKAVSDYNTYGGENDSIATVSLCEDEGMAEVTASVSIAD